ncbi:MAG: ABC transporter permease [Candidatus Nanoarchaeia archaeon]
MNNWVAFQTIVIKEVSRVLRIWKQTIFPSAITMTLYFIIFGNLIGSQINDIGGFSYMQFIVPGLIMMAVITNTYMNVCSSFYVSKFNRQIEELFVAPVHNSTIIFGFVSGGMVRGLIVGCAVWLVSFLFTSSPVSHPFIVIAFMLLTTLVFSLAGFINGIFANSFDDITTIPTFVLTPLTYLGGVFYSLDLLPEFFKTLSKLNPILYMVNGLRYGFLGVSDVDVIFGFLMLILFAVILFAVCIYLMNRGIRMKH